MKVEPKAASAVSPTPIGTKHPFLWLTLLLFVIFSVLFWKAYSPNYVAYSNDGPYGLQAAECNLMPGIISGVWSDLNWLGNEGISPSPDVRCGLMFLPLQAYMNLFDGAALFIAGLGACFCLRQFKLSPLACILGGIAAALNQDFFSTSCWGVASQIICFGANYFAIGLLFGTGGRQSWVKVVLAGLCVGVGIMEGFDNGAIFSLYVAAFALFHSLYLQEAGKLQNAPLRTLRGFVRIALVAIFAAWISVHTLSLLVGTQIRGVAAAAQDADTKAAQWQAKTDFSLPPVETLQVIVPGLFGYRNAWHMYDTDQPTDDQYWGLIGHTPGTGFFRLIGTGEYCGVLVVLVAFWAVFQSFRSRGSPYTQLQRRAIWFWFAALLISLVLAFGRYGPLYRFFYALPYASTIRNPVKFMHVFSWIIVILFGYGVHGLVLAYFQNPVSRADGVLAQFKKWRGVASPFERKWMNGCFALIGVCLLGWLLYASGTASLESYLQTVGFSATDSSGIAKFSLASVGWFMLLLIVTIGLLALVFSGQFSGSRAKWGGVALGALLVFDLGRADKPWIFFYDMNYKYGNDPIMNFLADKPYEHRVALPQPPDGKFTSEQQVRMFNAYGSHWNQHLFPLHNIQSFDVSQEPRVSEDKDRFNFALQHNIGMMYTLLNVRYLLIQNVPIDPTHFRPLKTFKFVPKRENPTSNPVDWKTQEDPQGELAVVEFLDALPRAKLYANWQVSSNDDETMHTIAGGSFDPHKTALVSDSIPVASPGGANPPDDAVKITNYRSKRTELEADAKAPSVLLMTERYNPSWHVEVDGKEAPVLRCNFIERGVYLTPGKHKVVFYFAPPMKTFYTSLVAVGLSLLLCGVLAVTKACSTTEPDTNPEPTPVK